MYCKEVLLLKNIVLPILCSQVYNVYLQSIFTTILQSYKFVIKK